MLEKWEKAFDFMWNHANADNLYDNWDKWDVDKKMIWADEFYNKVFKNGYNNSKIYSQGANALLAESKTPTADHFNSPRMSFWAMMDDYREVITDYDGLKSIVGDLRTIIWVTPCENNLVKYSWQDGKIKIKELTFTKYDDIRWLDGNTGNYFSRKEGFPLKHLIPDFVTEYEKKLIEEFV